MPTSGNACARKGRSETWQFAKNKFWSDFVRKQTFRESRQVLLRKRMSRGFEFILILQTTRGSNFGLLATEVYLTSFIILVFSTCVRSIRESLGETTPAGFFIKCPPWGYHEFEEKLRYKSGQTHLIISEESTAAVDSHVKENRRISTWELAGSLSLRKGHHTAKEFLSLTIFIIWWTHGTVFSIRHKMII
ncbi:hypothetical protein AVEN_182963-1 [Araneus ventricosus]|uniref:Uncharacterized protein n=1 Tax=Araneus ventricosus TaxID=182803 RepID=A0A4Y2QCI3_ARAVE|nr:hypothetical protein AVEN_237404-1 [Araneus ventricosus]GBN59996.1 hypothetical protein AVEN_182963-1 [Araneus ventricosus]